MWIGDLLYGPRLNRAYRLDLDTVRELGEAVTAAYPEMTVRYYVNEPIGNQREVAAEDLGRLSAADLNRLTLDARLTMPEGQAYFGPLVNIGLGRQSWWLNAMAAPAADGSQTSDDALTTRLHQILTDSSRPLIRKRKVPVRALLTVVPFLALVGGWVWLELTTPLPVPAHVIGWAIVLVALIVTRPAYRAAKVPRMNERQPLNGHIVLSETRKDTAARRADSRRDIKVSVLTVVGTIVAGVIVAGILVALGWNVEVPASTPTP